MPLSVHRSCIPLTDILLPQSPEQTPQQSPQQSPHLSPRSAHAIATDPLGRWPRVPSKFRSTIPSPDFPVARGRYVLYVNYCCPWAHRTILIHALKGLDDIVQLIEVDSRDQAHGWWFSGRRGPDRDPLYGGRFMKDLYLRADPNYNGRITVPMLWDTKYETIVNNESSDIMRILSQAFDEFLPLEKQERSKGDAALVPKHLEKQIDVLNSWVYDTINNGVYKAGFAGSQSAYEEHVTRLFQSLDQLEYHMGENAHYPYLFGEHITEADIRLFPTIVRFDVVYYTLFKCNIKMIRLDYPRIHAWLRRLYWNESPEAGGGVFKKTTIFEAIKYGYSSVAAGNGIIPAGPTPHILPL